MPVRSKEGGGRDGRQLRVEELRENAIRGKTARRWEEGEVAFDKRGECDKRDRARRRRQRGLAHTTSRRTDLYETNDLLTKLEISYPFLISRLQYLRVRVFRFTPLQTLLLFHFSSYIFSLLFVLISSFPLAFHSLAFLFDISSFFKFLKVTINYYREMFI